MPRIVTRVLPGLLLFAVLGWPTLSAQAQPKAKKDPKTEAVELFEQSVDLYRQGKFDEAAALLERAYSLHDEPVLLYNLGRAYEGLGENQKAIDAYTKYIEKTPEAKDRGALERRIVTLKEQMREGQAARGAQAPARSDPHPTLAPTCFGTEQGSRRIALGRRGRRGSGGGRRLLRRTSGQEQA